MIVTVDYDVKGDERDDLFLIRLQYLCRSPGSCEVRRTARGYHVYLALPRDDPDLEAYLRAYLLDDEYRMALDFVRYAAGYRLGNVLYELKADPADPGGLGGELGRRKVF